MQGNGRDVSGLRFFARAALLTGCAVLAQCYGIQAQTESAQPIPSITVNARLVVLDVVVADKDGKLVDNLSQSDFKVLEDGKLQRIRSFELPAHHTLPAATVDAGVDATFDPAKPASFGQSPVNILVLDQLNTRFADSSFARRALADYLHKQPQLLAQPATLLTVYDNNFKQLQGFTRNRDLLLKALDAAPTKYAWKLEVNGKTDHGPLERLEQSVAALEEMAQSYAGIPGRKNLIWVGGGFPSIDPEAIAVEDEQEIKDTLKHVTDVLIDTHVTLYAVDPSSSAPGMTEITDAAQMAFINAGADAPAGTVDPFGASDDFDSLGPVTGGRVVRNRNDVAEIVASSVDMGSNFYTIAYSPSSSSDEAVRFRKISVVCLKPGLVAMTRSGYYAGQTKQDKSHEAATYDLMTAAESSLPLNGLQVAAQQDSSPNAPPGAYLIRVGAANLSWKPAPDGTSTANVMILGVSLNASRKMIGHSMLGMIATAKAGTDLRDPARLADFVFPVTPAPKSAMLRLVVRDNVTGRMGSVDLPLKP